MNSIGRGRKRPRSLAPSTHVSLTSEGVKRYLHTGEEERDGDSTGTAYTTTDLVVGSTQSLNLRLGRPLKFPLQKAVHIYAPNRSEERRGTEKEHEFWERTQVTLRTDKHFPGG